MLFYTASSHVRTEPQSVIGHTGGKKKLYQGSEFGHWKVTGGHDAFAFRHPSLAQTDVRQLLDSEAHHHKVCPIGTGRLIALVGVSSAENATAGTLSVMFGLVSRPLPKTCVPLSRMLFTR